MSTNNFYKEFINFVIDDNDRNFLNLIKNTYKNKADIIRTAMPDGTIRIFKNYKNFFLKESSVDYKDQLLFKKILHLCRNTVQHSDLDYVYGRSHLAYIPGSLPYHIDKRKCVLSIPIGKIKYPITWVDNKDQYLFHYYYNVPVLINTEIRHGCVENNEDRFLFQIGFNEPFEVVKNLLDI